MTEYDLSEWRDKTTVIATINIAEKKFAAWRTHILFPAPNTDAVKELLLAMETDTLQLWESGLKGSLVDCIYLYNKVWNRIRMLFLVEARTDILERDELLNDFASVNNDLADCLFKDTGKESTE